jgi:hypothetical protein
MTMRANGRSALILAAGLLVCFAASSPAAAGSENAPTNSKPESAGAPVALNKYVKHRHARSNAHRRSSKVAQKQPDSKKTAEAAVEDKANPSAIPASVANANAQLTPGDSPAGNAARAMTARATDIVQSPPDTPADAQPAADAHVVAADELNDVDRALREGTPLAVASAEAPAAPAPTVAVSGGESSTWDQTSLIGKIFIGFGALLTMASAARMFMA